MPVGEYGGYSYGKRRATQVKQDAEHCASMRCLNCNKLGYVPRHVLSRGKRVPCTKCGGTLIETEAEHKRQTGHTAKQVAKLANQKLGIMEFQCRYCMEEFRSETGLRLHIRDHHEDF